MTVVSRRAHAAFLLLVSLVATVLTLIGGSQPSFAADSASRPELRAEVVRLVNRQRAAHGCKRAVAADSHLTKSAQGHASDMAAKNYFSHTSKDGRTWVQRIRRAGYPDPGGENIAHGFSKSAGVVVAWMRSQSHKRNILDCSFRKIGVGFDGDGDYWVQDFGY